MPYIKFSQEQSGKTEVWTVRLEDLSGWIVASEPRHGPPDAQGRRAEMGATGRMQVRFPDPFGSGQFITLTPDQSDAFLRVVESQDVYDLDSAEP